MGDFIVSLLASFVPIFLDDNKAHIELTKWRVIALFAVIFISVYVFFATFFFGVELLKGFPIPWLGLAVSDFIFAFLVVLILGCVDIQRKSVILLI
ncbi:hypothetical protein [Acinetobacter sp. c3-l95]|uniref:hypothetical protein n=1 Tax=Acinetobacter sp. c3-l95 TaxID=3342804 RepID=UPI0035BB628F